MSQHDFVLRLRHLLGCCCQLELSKIWCRSLFIQRSCLILRSEKHERRKLNKTCQHVHHQATIRPSIAPHEEEDFDRTCFILDQTEGREKGLEYFTRQPVDARKQISQVQCKYISLLVSKQALSNVH